MPTTQEIEDYIRQNAGVPIQQGAAQGSNAIENKMHQAGAAAMAMKQAALQQLSGSPQQATPPPQAQPIPDVLPNDPSMSPKDAQNRMGAMIQAPATMEQVAAKLRAQADEDAAAEQHANSLQDQDMSGYQDYGKPAPQKFQQLRQKIQSKPQSAPEQEGAVEVTPEMEKQLFGSDEDEDNK